jgi:hypothetical protein
MFGLRHRFVKVWLNAVVVERSVGEINGAGHKSAMHRIAA